MADPKFTFHIAHQKDELGRPPLNDWQIFTDEVYQSMKSGGLPANTHWTHVEIADKSQQTLLIGYINSRLATLWNDSSTRKENINKKMKTVAEKLQVFYISMSFSES